MGQTLDRQGGSDAMLIALGVLLFGIGMFGKVIGVDGAIVLVGPAMILFVIGAWRAAHPERGGNVGGSDINPWTVG
jgi:hypothetical protein